MNASEVIMKLFRLVLLATLVVYLLPAATPLYAQEPESPAMGKTKTSMSQSGTQQTTAQSTTPDVIPETAPPDPALIALHQLVAWQRTEAETTLSTVPETEGSSQLLLARGMAKAVNGDFDGSLALLQQAQTANPIDPAAPYYRGEVFLMKRDAGQATASWRLAEEKAGSLVSQNPTDATANYYLGAAEIRIGQFDLARNHMAQALESGFSPLLVNYQVGLSYAFQRQWTQAKESFDAVLEQDERFAHAYYYRAIAWDKLKHKGQMLVDFDRFVKLAPTAPESSHARALLAASKR